MSGIRVSGRVIACVILALWAVVAGCGAGHAQDALPTELRIGLANEPDSDRPAFP